MPVGSVGDGKLGLLWGCRAIGEFLGIDDRKTLYLVRSGKLPSTKIGKEYCASETVLTEYLESKMRACLPHGEVK